MGQLSACLHFQRRQITEPDYKLDILAPEPSLSTHCSTTSGVYDRYITAEDFVLESFKVK